MTRTGGCACGAIRFELTADPIGAGACHCTDCQKASGGGPSYVVLAPGAALNVTKGTARLHVKTGDSGNDVKRAFCAECGTPLWSQPSGQPIVPIKLGAFDDSSGLEPGMHIYTSSAPHWHQIDRSKPCFDKMPTAG